MTADKKRKIRKLRMKSAQLASLDRKLLAELQKDVSLNSEILGDRIGLSASAVLRRLKTLRRAGVITSEVAVLDADATGYSLTLVALIELERENVSSRGNLNRWCCEQAQVQQAYYTTGSTDLILVVLAKSIPDFDALMSALQEANPTVRRITTNVTIEVFKKGLEVPL